MKVINDIILNQSNQSSLDLGTTNDVIVIQSDNEVSLNSTDSSTYQSVLSCSQTGIPAVEMQATDLGSTFSRVQVLNTGTLFIESSNGTDTNTITMTPTTTNIQTPTTLYQADQSGNVEVRADTDVRIYGDYQGNQPLILITGGKTIELNAGADAAAAIKLATLGLTTLAAFDDDAAAGTAGLTTGMIYQTTGLGAAPLDAAGIVMIKQ